MFKVHVPTDYYFGEGALEELSRIPLPGKKAFICTTNGRSVRRFGYLAKLEDALKAQGIESVIFDEIEPNPTKNTIMKAASSAKSAGCDFVLGFGGGSPMDAAKVIALMATNPGDLWDYCFKGSGGKQFPSVKPLPIVCVSTTAGTGSELDAGGVITNTDTNEKFGIGFPSLFPTVSVVDPLLTLTVPKDQTIYQGMDTFYHLAEGYLSKAANLMNEMYALEGIAKTVENLPKCAADGSDREARRLMSFANSLGGLVMATGTLVSQHAMEHVLSAHYPKLPHGAGLMMLAPAYFEHLIRKGASPERFVRLACVMGMKDATRPEDFLLAHQALLDTVCATEVRMSDYGIRFEELRGFAREVKETASMQFKNDPVELTEADVASIYEAAWR